MGEFPTICSNILNFALSVLVVLWQSRLLETGCSALCSPHTSLSPLQNLVRFKPGSNLQTWGSKAGFFWYVFKQGSKSSLKGIEMLPIPSFMALYTNVYIVTFYVDILHGIYILYIRNKLIQAIIFS